MRRTLLAALVSLCFAGTALAQAPYPGAPAAPPPGDAAAPPPASTTVVVVQRPQLATIVIEDLPERCKLLAKRTAVPHVAQQLSARIALATCLADARASALSLIDGPESVLALEQASEQAFAILDNVIDVGDPAAKVMALRAKADLYAAMSARMAATVPPLQNATPEAIALRDTRRQIALGMTLPWRDRGRELHEAIVELGRKSPQLARNPVAQTAIRDSEQKLAVPVATR
jgi:hypothetical protein